MKDSLVTMNGYVGLGTKALKICNAVPKPKGAGDTPTTNGSSTSVTTTDTTSYSQYYDPSYWQNYAANWQQVRTMFSKSKLNTYKYFLQSYYDQSATAAMQHSAYMTQQEEMKKEEDLELIGKN